MLDQFDLADAAVNAAQLEGQVAVQSAVDAEKIAQLDAQLAADKLARISADLDQVKRRVGIQVPVDELVFLPELPVRVEQLIAKVGDAASGPVLTVTDNRLAVDSALPLDAVVPVSAPFIGAGIGLLSGLYPAMRAALLEPVEAFRN